MTPKPLSPVREIDELGACVWLDRFIIAFQSVFFATVYN